MALVKNFCSEVKPGDLNPHSVSEGLGILQYTISLGRKRVVEPLDCPFRTPSKKHYNRFPSMKSEMSPLETLPQGILIQILCGVGHDDLKQVFYVSKAIREAILIAKQSHFAFSTPYSKTTVPRSSDDTTQFDNEEAPPDAPRRPRHSRSRGYDTIVGERGVQMSGGQKQRVAIARAIVKNRTILLLDEATSAMDAEFERVVQEALDRVMVKRTTIMVAHRLFTIKGADLIAAVKNGIIAKKGTHETLINIKDSIYASLVAIQRSTS